MWKFFISCNFISKFCIKNEMFKQDSLVEGQFLLVINNINTKQQLETKVPHLNASIKLTNSAAYVQQLIMSDYLKRLLRRLNRKRPMSKKIEFLITLSQCSKNLPNRRWSLVVWSILKKYRLSVSKRPNSRL
jgi:hypothetical protein